MSAAREISEVSVFEKIAQAFSSLESQAHSDEQRRNAKRAVINFFGLDEVNRYLVWRAELIGANPHGHKVHAE